MNSETGSCGPEIFAGCSQVENALQLQIHDGKTNLDSVQSFPSEVAVIGIDAMIRSNSTLEDFVRIFLDNWNLLWNTNFIS